MNQKLNWMRRGRMNTAGADMPVRFNSEAAFEVKIKKSVGNKTLNLDRPLISGIFDLRACVNGIEAQVSLSLFKRRPAMTLHETMLDERRLEAVLKAARKKRC
ncbi:MAG TPA: hypothetical protein VGJ73_19210 [Verrucomicrobiae bacterium]